MRTPRAFFLLSFATIAAAAMPAWAQVSPGIIYWKTVTAPPNTTDHFKFTLNTANNMRFRTYPNLTNNPSSYSAYPLFGRVFFIEDKLPVDRFGTIPGTRKPISVLRLVSERQTAEVLTLTNFNGPEWIDQADVRWSSENRDSFFSFQAYVPRTGQRKVYRYNGSKSGIFTPIFRPLVPNDPRLTVAFTFRTDEFFTNDWNSTGNRLMFSSPGPFGFVTRVFDSQTNNVTVVNDPAVSGFSLNSPVFSPTNPDIAYSIAETPGGTRGVAAFNVTNQNFGWILIEGNVGGTPSTNFTNPQVSPDGRFLAFTMLRTILIGKTVGPAVTLVRVPVTGGGAQPLWTVGHSRTNNFEVTGWTPVF
jgi:hypothetical protein